MQWRPFRRSIPAGLQHSKTLLFDTDDDSRIPGSARHGDAGGAAPRHTRPTPPARIASRYGDGARQRRLRKPSPSSAIDVINYRRGATGAIFSVAAVPMTAGTLDGRCSGIRASPEIIMDPAATEIGAVTVTDASGDSGQFHEPGRRQCTLHGAYRRRPCGREQTVRSICPWKRQTSGRQLSAWGSTRVPWLPWWITILRRVYRSRTAAVQVIGRGSRWQFHGLPRIVTGFRGCIGVYGARHRSPDRIGSAQHRLCKPPWSFPVAIEQYGGVQRAGAGIFQLPDRRSVAR